MRVLVIGGTGFIGSRLVSALGGAGYQIRVLSRRNPQSKGDSKFSIEFLKADLLDSDAQFDKIVSDCVVVFNCAGELYNEELMNRLHVEATLRLVRACKDSAKATNRLVHWVQLSSVGAYGPGFGRAGAVRCITEESTTSPVGTYEITKTKADELIISAAEKGVFSYSILRPSNVYGAGMSNNSIRQWGNLIKRRLFFYVGTPGAIATYVHVDDVVEALVLCGFDRRAKCEIFNISNDCPQDLLVDAMARALNVLSPKLRVPEKVVRFFSAYLSGAEWIPISQPRIDALVARTMYPTNKIEDILGYHPRRDVCETIAEVLFDEGNNR